jgi:hypothetical protein
MYKQMILSAKFKVGQIVRLNDTDYIIVRATLLYNIDKTAPYYIEKDSVSISYCLVNKHNDDIILNEETLLKESLVSTKQKRRGIAKKCC